jgi:hypothetical protein
VVLLFSIQRFHDPNGFSSLRDDECITRPRLVNKAREIGFDFGNAKGSHLDLLAVSIMLAMRYC